MSRSVVVVGGGVIGTACAYYLSRAGWQVTILDQGRFGRGCSHANCGFVCPSHVLPLAAPGAVAHGPAVAAQTQFRPFPSSRASISISVSWLARFALRCSEKKMLEAGARHPGAPQFLTLPLRRTARKPRPSIANGSRWGSSSCCRHAKPWNTTRHTAKLLHDTFGLPDERFEGSALNDLEPALKPGLAGGWLYRTDAHLRPDRLLAEWRRVLEGQGVKIQEDCAVHGFAKEGTKARAAVVATGEVPADAFVLAAGAWSPHSASSSAASCPSSPARVTRSPWLGRRSARNSR